MDDILAHSDETVVISTNRLTKAYGNLIAVNDLHLQVMRGDVFGFLGPNGAGKTTTIRMLLGLIRPTAGRAILFGMDNAYLLPEILQRVGAIVETPVFYPYLSGLDNLRISAASSGMMSGKSNDRRLAEVLEIVELQAYEKLSFRQYSLGMKQRLGIAAALLTDPELVLLDEPTNGLDPAGMIEIRRLILRLSSLGKTIFLSSHILHEVQQVCNRVAIMQKGNLVTQGNVSELLKAGERVEVRMNEEQDLQQALHIVQQAQERDLSWIRNAHIEVNQKKQAVLVVDAPISHSAEINALLARHELFASAIYPQEGSLEELFLEVTTTATSGTHAGMEALAGTSADEQFPLSELPGAGKEASRR